MKTGRQAGSFITTKEHRRFTEFVKAVKKHRYIGLCFGAAGVGKTLSARRYAHWDLAESLVRDWGPRDPSDAKVYAALHRSKSVFFTSSVGGTLSELRSDLKLLTTRVEICMDQHVHKDEEPRVVSYVKKKHPIELIIIDEAERLSTTALEYVRDIFDRTDIGLILIGMPGIEKRMARYPQLYSRVGFVHHYKALQDDELTFVLTRHWKKLGLNLDEADFTDTQAIAAISRVTRGNFRLLQRLFIQIERILRINDLTLITADVVETACSSLVIGVT